MAASAPALESPALADAAAAEPLELAGPGLRAVAQVFNSVLSIVWLGILAFTGAPLGLGWCLILILPLVLFQWLLLAFRGQDLGKLIVGLKVVEHGTRAPAKAIRLVLWRTFLNNLLRLFPPYALVDIAFIYGGDQRCLHDRIAGTEVVRLRRTPTLVDWAFAQIGEFLSILGQVALLGVIASMVRREFHWKAFGWGFVLLAVAIVGTAYGVFAGTAPLYGTREVLLWIAPLGAAAAAGFLMGKVGRRIAFWESYLVCLVVAGLVFVHLQFGFDALLGVGGEDEYSDFMLRMSPGARHLGPMWDRLLLLTSLGAFLLSLVGGSFAFLLFSTTGELDASFQLEWFVARRHLAGRGGRGLVSVTAVVAVLGIMLGVAALVAVTAVMSGYQQDIQSKILSTNAHLVVQKYGIDFTEHERIREKVVAMPEVLAGSPFTFNEAMLSVDDLGVGVLLKGVVPETAGSVTAIERNLCASTSNGQCSKYQGGEEEGALARILRVRGADEPPQIIVGYELFKRLNVPVGTRVTITTPVGIAGARGNAPKRMVYELAGAFQSGMHEFDSRLGYLELAASQKLMGLGEAVNGVELRVQDPERVEALSRKVLNAAGRYPFRTLDWRELNRGIFTALKLQKIVMFLVLCFIVVVASFNIASTLFMAVVEKAHEIAVLKSMGSRDASLMKVFVLQGWTVGGIGTLLGVLLGLGVCAILSQMQLGIAASVYMVESLEVQVQPVEVGVTVFAALAISHLASVFPAIKAARQRPVDAMRYSEV